MNTKGLSLNTIPPILIPLRFFLTAPLFGILAAMLMFYYGETIWLTRWSSSSLALTHLMTIGFMLTVMIGALYQFIPVMIGQLIPGSNRLVPIIHPLLVIGSILLTCGFLTNHQVLYGTAFLSLFMSLTLFASSLLPLLVSSIKNQLVVFLLRVLFLVLLMTIGLGLYMLLAHSMPQWDWPFRPLTDIHALWGLLGWVVILIMAVSSQVIPMFFVTPEFSVKYLKGLSVSIVLSLMLISVVTRHYDEALQAILSLQLVFFAFYTLKLINLRKRKLPDTTVDFITLSAISLFVTIVLWWLYKQSFDMNYYVSLPAFEFTIAILLIYGLALSAIIGMMQKIVPFLIYLNLQNLSMHHPGSITLVPNMKNLISVQNSRIQFYVHLVSFILLLMSVFLPIIIWIAAVMLLFNFTWLSYCIYNAFFVYKKNKKQILTFPEMKLQF